MRRLREGLQRARLDAAVIVQHADLAYFSGTNQQAHLVVPAQGEPRLLVRRVLERARRESPLERIEPLRSLSALAAELAASGAGRGWRGSASSSTCCRPARTSTTAAAWPGYELGDCSEIVRAVRAVKSAWDLEQMAAAVRAGAPRRRGRAGADRRRRESSLTFSLRLRE